MNVIVQICTVVRVDSGTDSDLPSRFFLSYTRTSSAAVVPKFLIYTCLCGHSKSVLLTLPSIAGRRATGSVATPNCIPELHLSGCGLAVDDDTSVHNIR